MIRFFQQRIGAASASGSSASSSSASLFARPDVASVPKLEIRKVDSELPKGAVALKKKADQDEESWGGFGGSKKGKKGGKKGGASAPAATAAEGGDDEASAAAAATKDEKLNLPLGTLTALMGLGIAAPLTTGEVQKAIDSLQLKMRYFKDNQVRSPLSSVSSPPCAPLLTRSSALLPSLLSPPAGPCHQGARCRRPEEDCGRRQEEQQRRGVVRLCPDRRRRERRADRQGGGDQGRAAAADRGGRLEGGGGRQRRGDGDGERRAVDRRRRRRGQGRRGQGGRGQGRRRLERVVPSVCMGPGGSSSSIL